MEEKKKTAATVENNQTPDKREEKTKKRKIKKGEKLYGYAGRVLKIDLTTKTSSLYPLSDEDRRLFIGGKILAARIMYDFIDHPIDPLSEENVLVVSTGPLTCLGSPCSSRFNVSTISPLTGILTSSNCGGNFGMGLKRAGYDALILTGKCDSLTVLEIVNENVTFTDATPYQGMMTTQVQEAIGGKSQKLVIGPAGENKVLYACAVSNDRAAGRGGIGAVMGSKNLKAITVEGYRNLEIFDKATLRKVNKRWVKRLREHPLTGNQLPRLGTSALLSTMQQRNMLATKNFSTGKYEGYRQISGEELNETRLIRNRGCTTCAIQCARVVEVDGKQVKGPEVEIMGLMGANILNDDLDKIIRWNYEMDELGMDTISCAGTIAFAMELNEKGMWKSGLKFGEVEGISEVLHDIAHRRGIGDKLANGSRKLSDEFGGEAFCIQSKGMELSAYEPRGAVGQGLGYSISNRGGCHLNGGYLVVLEGLGLTINPYTARGKAEATIMFQNLMEAISACGNCLFTSYAFFPFFLFKKPNSLLSRIVNGVLPYLGGALTIVNKLPELLQLNLPMMMLPYPLAVQAGVGMKWNMGRMLMAGMRGYNLERLINTRLGISRKDDKLPDRLTKELQIKSNPKSHVPQEKLLEKYYKGRSWDENGIPKHKLLKKLSLLDLDNIGMRNTTGGEK